MSEKVIFRSKRRAKKSTQSECLFYLIQRFIITKKDKLTQKYV